MNYGDLFRKLAEDSDVTAASPDHAGEEFTAACRRVDQDPGERQRITDIANLIDTEDTLYAQALSALGRGEQSTALPLLRQTAEAGIGEAAWLLARQLEEQGQAQESLLWYQRAADDGDPRAARRILSPRAGNGYPSVSPLPDDAGRPGCPRASGQPGSGWMTRIVIPAAAAAAVVAVVVAITAALPRGGAPSTRQLASSNASASRQLADEAAARTQAITWILQQVTPGALVSCDPQICADLASRGFPPVDLVPTGASDPLGSDLVVATAAIRARYGGRLASVFAPAVIASFGSGPARIDIRQVFPGGADAYRAVQGTDLSARKSADAQLLANSHITLSATARAQLLRGDIDPRLPLLLLPWPLATRCAS